MNTVVMVTSNGIYREFIHCIENIWCNKVGKGWAVSKNFLMKKKGYKPFKPK